ncbi:MAG TPA: sigma 54-interacting transcriptional regulator [Cyclobacteriaceae bacterium]|nr:sigma 54-interacting transcriptional regulator [Cyclobacteriaceae bacterium]
MSINTTNQILPSQLSILIVEDEFAVANDLRQILEKAGYRVIGIAFTVAKAIELKNQQKPDLVLLDIILKGGQTGIDLARLLAEENIPFIYVSANTNSSILEEVKTTKPYGFIVKPFREKDVLVALEIAHYRHAHSIEMRVRQEQALQIALTDAFSGNDPWEDRLLKVTRLFQGHIPFDYFIIGFEKNHLVDAYRSCSLFRIGKEEYQIIWIENFLQMTGLSLEKYQAIREQLPDMTDAIYNGKEFEELCRRNPIKRLVAGTFNMQSNLIIPLTTATNGAFFLSFFSRQPYTFLKEHLSILERLRPSLALTVDRLMAFDQIQQLSEQLDRENKYLQEEVKTGANYEEMIGESSALVNVFKSISQVAPTDYTVLILGETGTGKELIARAVHNRSSRKNKALIKVNCAALPPQLIESELFGHEKGSFTGATERRIGKFELARGGTIFLDEIGELPIDLQPKLLRVLQEREVERVGGKGPIPVDVRIIAATNRNLQDEISAGRFRSDLYYRLNVFPVIIPPLRERTEDLMPLAIYFLQKISKKLGKNLTGISESSKLQMLNYHWPGNIRELEHLLERAAIMATSPVISLVEPLISEPSSDTELAVGENPVSQIVKPHIKAEKDNIMKALNLSNFRIRGKGGAAELLDIKPTTLEAKMARLGIRRDR